LKLPFTLTGVTSVGFW